MSSTGRDKNQPPTTRNFTNFPIITEIAIVQNFTHQLSIRIYAVLLSFWSQVSDHGNIPDPPPNSSWSYRATSSADVNRTSVTCKTSSTAVAKRPRDASCLSVVSFNSTKRRVESFIVTYVDYRFITACS